MERPESPLDHEPQSPAVEADSAAVQEERVGSPMFIFYEESISNPLDDSTPITIARMVHSDSVPSRSSTPSDVESVSNVDEGSNTSASRQHRSEDRETYERPAKIPHLEPRRDSDDQDGETCPICLETWNNCGPHRLVALKCGHLFGMSCVQRWLKAQPVKERYCPTCKKKAHMHDLRHIYARRLIAADTTEVTALQAQVETLQAVNDRLDLELYESKEAHRSCLDKLDAIASESHGDVARQWGFSLERNIEISREGECRVMAYNSRTYELCVSQKSASPLFTGYGLRRVSCVDGRVGPFLHLHTKPVRDLSYSPDLNMMLTASLDGGSRAVRLGEGRNQGAGVAVRGKTPLWSCVWGEPGTLYVGGANGVTLQFDQRCPNRPLRTLARDGDRSPVVSLALTPRGLLACTLSTVVLWAAGGGGDTVLQAGGAPYMSLRYVAEWGRVLLWTRRGALQVCSLEDDELKVHHTFQVGSGSARMTRACAVSAGGVRWVAAHAESDARLHVERVGAPGRTLLATEPALDLCAPVVPNGTLLAALSDTRLRLYRPTPI